MKELSALLSGLSPQVGEFLASLLPALGVLLAGLLLRRMLLYFFSRLIRRRKASQREGLLSSLWEACHKPVKTLLLLFVLYAAASLLRLPTESGRLFFSSLTLRLLRMGFILCICWALFLFISPETVGAGPFFRSQERLGQTFCLFCSRILRALIAAFGTVILLGELGFDPTGLITGLGLGGLTLALAAQDWASNLFGGLVILLDRPFSVNDWIQVEDTIEGIVEDVSFRSTRIRTFDNAQVVSPNSLLVSKPIVNWSRMQKRKISFDIGLTYDSPPDRLAECIKELREDLGAIPEICEEPQVVVFNEFAESSLNVRIHCFSRLTGFADYMQLKERLNFEIMQTVARCGLAFAFPTRTLYLEKNDGGSPADTVKG
ncbi:MAG: mechanosensitive ion channel family protein [Provencibacterium sp.]|nr:mechanosensitive ion channel family protein [Provencibacterium sp.]